MCEMLIAIIKMPFCVYILQTLFVACFIEKYLVNAVNDNFLGQSVSIYLEMYHYKSVNN